MFKIDLAFRKKSLEVNSICHTDNISVSGKIELPYVVESDKNQSVILIGEAKSYEHDWVDISIAANKLLRNEANETDFYGEFLSLRLLKNNVNIYTDAFGQFPVYYAIDSEGGISLSSGPVCKSLIQAGQRIDIDFILNYINHGYYLQGRTAVSGLNILSPGFRYSLLLNGILTKENVINDVFAKAQISSPFCVLRQSLARKVTLHDKIVLELSGGVESSSIAAVLSKHKKEKDIRFLTYYDKYSLSSNELQYAKKVSEHFNVVLDVIELSARPPFTPFTDIIPFHTLPGSYSCIYNQQHYIANRYDKNTLFINGHGGDSIYLAPSPPALFMEVLLNIGLNKAMKTLYGISLQHHSSIIYEVQESLRNRYLSRINPNLWYYDAVKNLSKYKNPATIFWWQTLASTISEVIPVLNSSFSGKNVFYPFLSSPVIINALKTGFDKFVNKEFNRYSLRKSVYINSGYKGIWRTDKGDTTHNMLEGLSKNFHSVRDFILDGQIADKKLINLEHTEKALKNLNLGLPDALPTIVRLYSAEACLRSIKEGGL